MRIIILGGDGFCGWPTSLKLANEGNEVLIIDNLSRRKIDKSLSTKSLTNIFSIEDRVKIANQHVGEISYKHINIAEDPEGLRSVIKEFKPSAIVHFAEQRAAPFSMLGDVERRYTIDNNITATHNLCSAIVDIDKDIHLIHLGTMGVYGYSKAFGRIPEGYLNIKINQTKSDTDILYPANPGSIYHMSKCLDQLIFQFYTKNWQLSITDLHQGIVWGIETDEMKKHEGLINRFDYDGIYGTVLNRFISQAANGFPLTVYGSGGQTRAFIHISDTAKCIQLAIKSPPKREGSVRIFNQVSEVLNVKQLAEIISEQYGTDIQYVQNPRKELRENELEVENSGLKSIGFNPITLKNALLDDIKYIADSTKKSFDQEKVLNSPKW